MLESAWSGGQKTPARLATAFALVRAGNLETGNFSPLGFLVNNLNQRAWRGVAQPYLAELARAPEQRRALVRALGSATTADEKIGLTQALAGSASADAIPALEQLSSDTDPAVAREALRALRILRGSVR